jgi:hypothetical protein
MTADRPMVSPSDETKDRSGQEGALNWEYAGF